MHPLIGLGLLEKRTTKVRHSRNEESQRDVKWCRKKSTDNAEAIASQKIQ